MSQRQNNQSICGYVELASPQLLDNNWRELDFDLASNQNVLQDLVVPEAGSGYVYRDASLLGSAVHNRFIYWRTTNDILELVEISTETLLEDTLVIIFASITSVHRICLPHPKTSNCSVLNDLTSDLLFNPANYYILGAQVSSGSQQPICATSWYDKSLLKCAISFPDSSILIVQFGHNSHHITTSEIKQTGIIGRLWSRMPNLWARSPNDCDNAVFVSIPFHHPETNDVLLFTLCRDCRIRVFSTNSKECVCLHNMIPQSSFSQSFASHTNPTTELPLMKIFGSLVVIYLTETRPEFVFLSHSFEDGLHKLTERTTIQTPSWDKLIDFSISKTKLWALANIREAESALCFMDVERVLVEDTEDGTVDEGLWDFVNMQEDAELSNTKSIVAEIFWGNHFSVKTVQKALIGITGPTLPMKNNMQDLEELAFTRIVDDDQDEAWTRFYNYCLQNHQVANKSIGFVVDPNESVISIIKRSNPSFVCPWIINVDMMLQGGPYRGIEYSSNIKGLIDSLNYISNELITERDSQLFETKLFENPSTIQSAINDMIKTINRRSNSHRIGSTSKTSIVSAIEYVCDQLDLTEQAKEFNNLVLSEQPNKIRSEQNPLESNHGIILTFELFRRLVRARMILARDLLIHVNILSNSCEKTCEDLYVTGKVKRIIDSLRSYAILVWLAETPIKSHSSSNNLEMANFIANRFEFFKVAKATNSRNQQESSLDTVVQQNLLMNFLAKGGSSFSWLLSKISQSTQAISNSYYISDVVLNICKLLWPKVDHLCLAEFMFTNQLDEHLSKYLILTQEWLENPEERHFINACNCLLQNRAVQAVEIFNRLWVDVSYTNLLGRFIELEEERESLNHNKVPINPKLIYRYHEELIKLFQLCNNRQSLVSLINHCMSLLDENSDTEQRHWVNSLRAQLFQFYLELEDSDEAYHTMVLMTDERLRTNCLRKFIVSHCEKELWSNLLSYPFIDIKEDFIEILNQKAESLDLSNLNSIDFYRTTYYDLLYASYVSDEEYKQASHVMYNYAQRLSQEVPGIMSIRKQTDCLLIALNSLRCVDDGNKFIDCGSTNQLDGGRSSVLKRTHDSEIDSKFDTRSQGDVASRDQVGRCKIDCKEIERKYELTRARLRLLERDQTANAIALSPLKPEETISQLVASSMFSAAIDLALLFKTSMDIILEGLAAKYILIMRLSTVHIAVHQDIERGLSDLFTNSYSNIETYNYVANSTNPLVDRLWRLIDYYLMTYDGVSHRYNSNEFKESFSGTSLLMRVVAIKLLSAGYDVPASLRRMYLSRNPPELLKLLMKYDKLIDAAELATELIDRLLEPSNCLAFNSTYEPAPLYLPSHLILLLITYLNEDATNTQHIKAANALTEKLNRFRSHVKSF